MMWSGGLFEWESGPERVPGKRSDSGMVVRVTWVILGGMVFREIVLSLYAQSDVCEMFLVGEVVVVVMLVMGVVNIVGV